MERSTELRSFFILVSLATTVTNVGMGGMGGQPSLGGGA